MGPLRAFLQTLLPWVDVAALGDAPVLGEDGAIDLDLDLQQLLGGPEGPAGAGQPEGAGGDPPPPPAPDVD